MAHHEEGKTSITDIFFKIELLQHLLRPQVLIVAATVLLYATSTWRQKPEQLTGEVYDRDDRQPVAGVSVTLSDHSGKVLNEAETDQAGVFIFSVLGNTDYRLKLEKPGYELRQVVDSAAMNNRHSVILRIPMHQLESN